MMIDPPPSHSQQKKLWLLGNYQQMTLFVLHMDTPQPQVACPCGSMISSIFPLCIPQSDKMITIAFIMMLLYMYSTDKTSILSLVNPRRTREGYGSCLSVCYHTSCYIPRLRVQFAVLQGSLWRSQFMICVDFSESALFASLASFYDSKLLDFARASDSMT